MMTLTDRNLMSAQNAIFTAYDYSSWALQYAQCARDSEGVRLAMEVRRAAEIALKHFEKKNDAATDWKKY